MKKYISMLLLVLAIMPNLTIEVKAASSLDVVINEVAWAGSAEDSSAEWIELKNNTSEALDLAGWTIVDDGTSTYELSGTISGNGYLVLGKDTNADLDIRLSLANSGDSLALIDDSGSTIDTVNSSGGAWPAGNNNTKTSMERIVSTESGSDNWSDCADSSLSTPRGLNSVSESSTGTEVTLTVSDAEPNIGDVVEVTASISNVEDLFSYGFDIDYDAAGLTYQSATQGSFLSESGSVATSFNAEMENGEEGTIIVGEARTGDDKTGVNGDGTLFTIEFLVTSSGSAEINIVSANSFIASVNADIEADFENTGVGSSSSYSVAQVGNAIAVESEERYSIVLTWDAVSGADSYRVLRMNSAGDYEELDEIAETTYTDSLYVIPSNTYYYQIITIDDGVESEGLVVTGSDTRGIKGDNNRSDRVDGRDLENIAKHYGETYADEEYDVLIDTTYDGGIDGSDLIDLGVNWALTYE